MFKSRHKISILGKKVFYEAVPNIPIGTLNSNNFKDFVPTKHFQSTVYHVLRDRADSCPIIQSYAKAQKFGYLNINDNRVGGSWGRVNDPSDIWGTVLLDNGTIVKNSFEPMPTHRWLTNDGLATLTEFLHNQVIMELKASSQNK